MSQIRVNINNKEIVTDDGRTILDVALQNGIDVPHLCYDERIKPYGACGLCVVEIEGNSKLQRACSTFVSEGMIIKTNTPRTIETRKMALNLLASDHRGDCRPPCVLACPAHTDCQGYVGLIANGEYKEALKLIKEHIPIPACIGRICPHPCEEACRRNFIEEPVSIAALKDFVAQEDLKGNPYIPEKKLSTGKNVAIVGSGPAGISCAFYLTQMGHNVTIYEAMPHPGGMLRYGIPQYRLDKNILEAEIDIIKKMGVNIQCNIRVGDDVTLESLRRNNDAVFIGIGAWDSIDTGCKGEDLKGVIGGIYFLREVAMNNTIQLGKKVIVIGGGNTAMDVARTAIRLGAEKVTVLYRRTRGEMSAEDIEINEAEEEGVEFKYLLAPKEIIGKGGIVSSIICNKMKLVQEVPSHKKKVIPTGEEVEFEADTVIEAIGQKVALGNIKGLKLNSSGTIVVNEFTYETNISGVFAGGDAAIGPKMLKIAVQAIAQGQNVANIIDNYLKGFIIPHVEPSYITIDKVYKEDFKDKERVPRQIQKVLDIQQRKKSFRQVSEAFTEEQAKKESKRCLECGCRDYFECQLFKYINEYNINIQDVSGYKHNRKLESIHPFIERNSDKCILCGLCIRVCDEVMGVSALGLVDRGFDSVVKPEFGLPLEKTSCISCGQCVDICPTGACMEKQSVSKQVPVSLKNTNSICGYCGMGCNLLIQTKGDLIFRNIANKNIDEGILCARGRFGISYVNDENRLIKPLINTSDGFKEVSWNEGIINFIKYLQKIVSVYGEDSIAFICSPRVTNEEAFLVRKIAEKLGSHWLSSFTNDSGCGLEEIFGYDASTNSFDELYSVHTILSIGKIAENQPIMGIKIRMAAKKGAEVISICNEWTRTQEWSKHNISFENNLDFFKGLIKSLINLGYVNENNIGNLVDGYENIKDYVKNAIETEDTIKVAKIYGESKKAIIVIDEQSVSKEGIQILGDIAALCGKVGDAHKGIVISRIKNNSQGIYDMGFKKSIYDIEKAIELEKIKGAVIIGENPISVNSRFTEILGRLEFLGVFDMFITETALKGDIIVPLVSCTEIEGSFTRGDRKIQQVNRALKPRIGKSNLDIFEEIAQALQINLHGIDSIREQIAREIPEYSGISIPQTVNKGTYWPNSRIDRFGNPVLYNEGFNTNNKRAKIVIPSDKPVFKQKFSYDSLELLFKL